VVERHIEKKDTGFARFLGISVRSVYETVAGFDLAAVHKYIDEELNQEIEDKAHNLVKQLSSFRNKLKQ
jgi:four helix bundle protein